jgi:hypothetical protein
MLSLYQKVSRLQGLRLQTFSGDESGSIRRVRFLPRIAEEKMTTKIKWASS